MLSEVLESSVSIGELIKLCAVDTELFARTFFPKAFRSKSPSFAPALWNALENPDYRAVNLRVFRGAGKTTRLRAFTAKRIAYGISRTILYIGADEASAVRSVQWLRAQIEPKLWGDGVERASFFAQTFGLKPGRKWQEHEIEIHHSVDDRPIWVMGVGITGSIRGINFDDYRPDLIIIDDVVTDQNALTEAQCDKIADLIMGAVKNSLAREVDAPNGKLCMLQTPINPRDVSMRAGESSEWHTENFGCWTAETADEQVEHQESAWEELFPTSILRKEKQAALVENRYSIFAREMECRLVAAETLSFRPNWLRVHQTPPKRMQCVLAIDPVPPPTDRQIASGLRDKDFEAIGIIGRNVDGFHVLHYETNRGHEPNWTVAKAFELHLRYAPLCWVVESVAYQRVLKWLLEMEMRRRGIYAAVKSPQTSVSKFNRIVAALSGPASQGRLWCGPQHSDFILQFESYGMGYKGKDDILDMVAMGVSELTNPYLELEDAGMLEEVEEFRPRRVCP